MTDTTGAAAAAADASTTDQQAPATGQQQQAPSPADLAGRPAPAATVTAPAEQGKGPAVDFTGWPEAAVTAYKARDAQANEWHTEAVKSRVNAKATAKSEGQAEILQKVAQALGLTPSEDEAPTVEKVTAQLTERTTEAEQARKDAALARTALALRVDPSKLDYLAYLVGKDDTIRGASPSDPAFADTLTNTVRGILSADPTLTAAALPSKSGADTYGGASGSEVTSDAFANMNAAERSKLYQQDPARYQALVDQTWEKSRAGR